MGQSETDWKQQRRHVFDWVAVLVVVLLSTIYLYLGIAAGGRGYYATTLALFSWLVVFFTDYWEAILYLPAALLVTSITAYWLWRGVWDAPLYQAAMVLTVVFLFLTSYLFIFEDPSV